MKVAEAVQHMTKSYLHRIVDSFTKDFPKTDEQRSREIIVKNTTDLTDPGRIEGGLAFSGRPYEERILERSILEAILEHPGRSASETHIIDEVMRRERAVLAAARNPDSLKYEDDKSIAVFRAVLEVAVEDATISHEELRLLRRLREKLGIREKTNQILLAQLGHFPRQGNRLHTPSEFREALLDLQKRGALFYCNLLDGGIYVIPDELAPGLRKALGIELSQAPWRLLLEHLSNAQLATILDSAGVPKSGRKNELVDRIVDAGISPSSALECLSNRDLYEICSSLPGANVSGTKGERRDRIIEYFGNLVVKNVPEKAEPGERYYEYLVELAHRDRENLLANNVIRKDKDMDGAFEEGTRYLFREKLGLDLLPMSGSEHADGCVEFRPDGDLLLWDTKSKEDVYGFPRSHLRQFKRYIRDSERRVSCFLVIVPEIGDGAEQTAARLKVESRSDTDVALITADDLKWLAEEWARRGRSKSLNVEVLNMTGVLDRRLLDQRLRLFG